MEGAGGKRRGAVLVGVVISTSRRMKRSVAGFELPPLPVGTKTGGHVVAGGPSPPLPCPSGPALRCTQAWPPWGHGKTFSAVEYSCRALVVIPFIWRRPFNFYA